MKLIGNERRPERSHEQERAPKPEKTPKKRGAGKRIIIILCSLVLIIAAAVIAYAIWETPPSRKGEGLVTASPSPSARPTSTAAPSPTPTPEPSSGRNDDIYTFLIVGMDQVGANTDTILVGALDTKEHSLDVVSIPRDTLVNTPYNVKKINALYAYNLNKGGDGITGLLEGAKNLLGFDVDCYAVVNIAAFEKLVDAVGGVDYDVPINMYYDDPTQNLHISIPKGYQHLDGEHALYVVRFREGNGGSGYANGDIGRIATQQDFLKSVAVQFIKSGVISNLDTVSKIFTEYVKTDLTAANISFFAREFLMCSSDNVRFHTLPGNYQDSFGGFSYVSLYLDEWLELVNTYLNPWREDVTEDNVNILTRKDGVLWSTSGVIEGGPNSFLNYDDYVASLQG